MTPRPRGPADRTDPGSGERPFVHGAAPERAGRTGEGPGRGGPGGISEPDPLVGPGVVSPGLAGEPVREVPALDPRLPRSLAGLVGRGRPIRDGRSRPGGHAGAPAAEPALHLPGADLERVRDPRRAPDPARGS